VEKPWYEDFFDDIYVNYLEEKSNKKAICNYLLNEFEIKPGALIFEQCCGTAEISRALAKKGFHIIGVDLSVHCIEKARKLSASFSPFCSYQQKDALNFITPEPVDAAFNWYTSFGYSENDAINFKMLKNAYLSLKEGGVYVLDYTNPTFILQNFKPYLEIKLNNRSGKIIKEVTIDMNRAMITSYWHYDFPELEGCKITKYGESKIYFPSTLKEMFLEAGFKDIKLHGNINAEPVTKDSARNIVVGRK
jgi:ubiquinone/menaquinone biosynthesis C-methylase UbiE